MIGGTWDYQMLIMSRYDGTSAGVAVNFQPVTQIEITRRLQKPRPIPAGPKNPTQHHRAIRGKEVYEGKTQILPEVSIVGHWHLQEALPGELRSDAHSSEFELHLVQEGRMDVWFDQPSRSVSVTGGVAMLTQPGQRHGGLREVLHPGRWFWLRFAMPPNRRFPGLPSDQSSRLLKALTESEPVVFPYSPSLETCFNRLMDEHRHPSPETPVIARAVLHELLVWIVRDCRNAGLRPMSSVPVFSVEIQRAVKWIEVNVMSPIAVPDLAGMVNMGESNFRRKFIHETGYSPRDYILHAKIDRAMEMLSNSNLSVTEIAMALGFATSAHFASMFRRRKGMRPSDYRRENGRHK